MPWEKPLSVYKQTTQKCTLFLFVSHEELFSVWRHVELKWKREVRVYFLFHHSHHVECISHCVETKNARKNLKTGPTQLDKWGIEQLWKVWTKSFVNNTSRYLNRKTKRYSRTSPQRPPGEQRKVLERWPLWGSRGTVRNAIKMYQSNRN